jgi:hypothetical protein
MFILHTCHRLKSKFVRLNLSRYLHHGQEVLKTNWRQKLTVALPPPPTVVTPWRCLEVGHRRVEADLLEE